METKRKRIALIIGQLTHGGAERQLYLLSKGLKNNHEYDPIAFCLSDYINPYSGMLSSLGITWHAYSGRVNKLLTLFWLLRTIKRENISLLYGFLHIGNIYTGLAALLTDIPYLTSIRNTNKNLPVKYKLLSGLSCLFAERVIANSHACVQALRRDLKVRHDRVTVIPNAVEIIEIDKDNLLRRELKIPSSAVVIGTVALLKNQKRHSFFIETFLHLTEIYQGEVHFVWVGDGPNRCEIDRIIEKLSKKHREHLHFIGYRTDIGRCLSSFDIFILTSAYEGMPNALLEAMAAGLPCVATEVEGTKDIFEMAPEGKEVGLLADPDNPDKFARALQRLLEEPNRMKQMGHNAKGYVEKVFGLQIMVKKHLEVFRKSLN